jgi:hypothetical protein
MRRLLRSIYHGFSPNIRSMLDSSISTIIVCSVVLLQGEMKIFTEQVSCIKVGLPAIVVLFTMP